MLGIPCKILLFNWPWKWAVWIQLREKYPMRFHESIWWLISFCDFMDWKFTCREPFLHPKVMTIIPHWRNLSWDQLLSLSHWFLLFILRNPRCQKLWELEIWYNCVRNNKYWKSNFPLFYPWGYKFNVESVLKMKFKEIREVIKIVNNEVLIINYGDKISEIVDDLVKLEEL